MAKVGIVMGSDSDMPIMAKAAEILDKLGIDYEMTIISAHREPDVFFDWAKSAEDKGFKVIIAGAGKAAHLPGMCAAIFPMPVIGIPAVAGLLRKKRRRGFAAWGLALALVALVLTGGLLYADHYLTGQAVSRWQQWPSTAAPMPESWRQRYWPSPMQSCWQS